MYNGVEKEIKMNDNRINEAPKYLHFAIPEFNMEKCKAAIILAIKNSNNKPEKLGKIRLHKILWFAEYLSLYQTRKLLFGGTFVKRAFGPYLQQFNDTIQILEQEGYISHVAKTRGDFEILFEKLSEQTQKIFINQFYLTDKVDYNDNVLSNDEKRMIAGLTQHIGNMGVEEISELTHNIHWQMAEENEWLPAELAGESIEITKDDYKFDIDESEL